ncbi:MAG: MarR family winged helix-turn-helix transcriptional regulator [Gordonia sp. (in: high G+C Gram-positive bacteria)]|uniref:MarR family winged helix-turn-helix transcriptional regulator n=1 Tax=Gordonia sp. (in: high G+C Gram-positive bacteria) TaxID=84139 RepID=UPI0039E53D22
MTAVGNPEHDNRGVEGQLTPEERRVWESVTSGGWKLLEQVNQGLSDAGFSSSPDLRVLETLGREPRMRISDVAAATHIQMSTISRQISRLIDQGLVERVDDVEGDDARHRWVRPTAAGREHLRELVACRDAMVRQHVIDVLGEDDFRALGEIYGKLA